MSTFWVRFATEELRSEHMERIHRKVVQQSEICEHCGKAFAKRAQVISECESTSLKFLLFSRGLSILLCISVNKAHRSDAQC